MHLAVKWEEVVVERTKFLIKRKDMIKNCGGNNIMRSSDFLINVRK
jgi:hypothetical protein